ncbi:PREDICTED: uncharacterized protein LOC107329016 [Paramuricea clavata]|uniref:PREDICTED: uncharacterized protein LOC107329016 n=1 Tax=Paramuricea clavata TaxID=317549 RepID=A0A6S7K4C4_PARCT|nr:PREDICTED: uncharacterized protein LOC107329016 [Paramuricea clavata]
MKPRRDRNGRNLGDSSTRGMTPKPIMVEELEKAEVTILKIIQAESFPDEVSALKRVDNRSLTKQKTTKLRKSSSLYRLDPFLGSDGLLRVGGRLRRCDEITTEMKHPVILPKNGHVAELIIRHNHENAAHGGRGITLNHLKGRYWIINANSRVRNYISRCVDCRKFRARTAKQKMADLPKDRLTSAAPLTYCGVDLFGPCLIKDGRKELKRYGVLFTCLNSRAIHLESDNSLETDWFLNALRRFIARRGPVREIRSDRGTNLIGAAKELKDALKEMDDAKINEYLCRYSDADWLVRWKPNPPAASHMGGVWERQIRTVRTILTSLMKEFGHVLNDESFRTLLTEAECIVNSRPLTFPSSDPTDLQSPISPNNILTMKSKIVMPPPGDFQRADLYLRRRWKRVQYLVEIFCTRWKREYLNTLQMRKKWNRPQRSFEIGDIVLVVDERTSRNLWPLARVIDITPDSVGAVRSVKVKTATSTLERPIVKLVLLLENS